MKITLIAYFFAGTFFANAFPHFFKGITGEKFPKRFPFRKQGESINRFEKIFHSPVVNVIWGIINFMIVFLLLYFNNFKIGFNIDTLIFLIGFVACSIFLAWNFGRVQNE